MNAPQRIELIEPAPVGAAANVADLSAIRPQRQLSVVEYAVQSGAPVAEVRALLELQVQADNHQLAMLKERRVMEKEDREAASILAFRKAFARLMGKNITIPKGKFVDRGRAGSFWHAEFHAASNLLKPALAECGFGFRHDQVFGSKKWTTDGVENDIPWVYVTCYLEHDDGHSERLQLEGPPSDNTANTPVQNMQVTGSVLKRQSLLAITGTPTGSEDDEGQLKGRGAEGDAGQANETDALITAGRDEALKGTPALTAWWGKLTSKQRNALNSEFGAMRRAAAVADKGGQP